MKSSKVTLLLIAAAFGYFVDVYDIILFTAVRVSSLKDLSVTGDATTSMGLILINVQLVGMIVGGLMWGVLGDKLGRIKVLFGSILLYSIANLLNATVTGVPMYAALRFIAGVGLAGELGAGVTLASEAMSATRRGYGTMLIATFGVLGGVAGGLVGDFFHWRTAYVIGGVAGLVLLIFRWGVRESTLYLETSQKTVRRGDILQLLGSKSLALRYLKCLLLGAPIWMIIGILITLSPEIGRQLGVTAEVSAGKGILFFNVGFAVGDLTSSFVSQLLKSRKKAAGIFLSMTAIFVGLYLSNAGVTPTLFYVECILMGLGAGYWAVFMMIGSEQFGTNLRATATTSLPNMVRGLVVPVSLLFHFMWPVLGILLSLKLLMALCIVVAAISLYFLRETFGSSLDYLEDGKQ